MNRKSIGLILLLAMSALSLSCGRHGGGTVEELTYKAPEAEEWVGRIHPLAALSDVEIHDGARMIISGDSLYIRDSNSSGNIIHVYDIREGVHRGSFAKRGEGPAEITNPGSMFVDRPKKTLYICDNGKWEVRSYHLDSIAEEGYTPSVALTLDKAGFPSNHKYVNDTLCFGRHITMSEAGWSESVCRFNLRTQEVIPFSIPEDQILAQCHSQLAPDPANRILYAVSSNYDIIQVFDFDGTLLKKIKGSDFSEKLNRETVRFTDAVMADGNLVAAYSGEPYAGSFFGGNIYIFDPEGMCLKNIAVPGPTYSMAYHEPTGRLYFCSGSDTQFYYVNLVDKTTEYHDGSNATAADDTDAPSSRDSETVTPASRKIISLIHPTRGLIDTDALYPLKNPQENPEGVGYYSSIQNLTQEEITITGIKIHGVDNARVELSRDKMYPEMVIALCILMKEPVREKTDVTVELTTNLGKQQLFLTLMSE